MRISLILFFCISVITFVGCEKYESPISSAIAEKVSEDEGVIINIAKLTSFNWDKLYFFDPYDDLDEIHNSLGTQFLEKNKMPNGVSEGDTLFVFMKNDNVVHYFSHPRNKGDFSGLKKYNWFTPENAEFEVVHEDYSIHGKWLKIVPVKAKK